MIQADKRRWKFTDNPVILKPQKPVIHPKITKFGKFSESQRKKLLHIKEIIVSQIGECTMSIFGSRIHGNWDKESDYDIIVYKEASTADREFLRKYDYGVEVDLFFSSESPSEIAVIF